MSDTANLPAVQEPTLMLPALPDQAEALFRLIDAPTARYRTNLPTNEGWAKAWIIATNNEPSLRLESVGDKIMDVTYWHAKLVAVTLSESGEVVPRLRVTLFDPKGLTLAWTSEITTQKFAELLGLYGLKPWDPPLKIKVVKNKGKVQGYFYTFAVDGLQVPDRKKGV